MISLAMQTKGTYLNVPVHVCFDVDAGSREGLKSAEIQRTEKEKMNQCISLLSLFLISNREREEGEGGR